MEEENKETDQKEYLSNDPAVIHDNKENEDWFRSKIEMLRTKLNNDKSKYSLDLQPSKTNYLIELSIMKKYHKLREVIEMLQPHQTYFHQSQYISRNELMFSMRFSTNILNNTFPKKDMNDSNGFNKSKKKLLSERIKENKTVFQSKVDPFINCFETKRQQGKENTNRYYNKETSSFNFTSIKTHDHKYASKQFYKDRLSNLSWRLFGNEKKIR